MMEDELFEKELRAIQPKKLSSEQLDAAELAVLGGELQNVAVPQLSEDLLDRFCDAIEGKELDNVIQFPEEKGAVQIPAPTSQKKFAWMPMAAAVAFLGMISALFVTQGQDATVAPVASAKAKDLTPNVVQVSKDSRIINAQSGGIYTGPRAGRPYELRKVKVLETFEVTNQNGEKVLIKKPVEKMIFFPPATD